MKEKFALLFSIFLLQLLLIFPTILPAESPIKLIYWKASDVERPSQEELESLENMVLQVQYFFASEMDRHGFGEKTFEFEDIVVSEGEQELNAYRRNLTSHREIRKESDLIEWGLDNQIYVVFLGGAHHLVSGALGLSQKLCAVPPEKLIYCNNMVVISADRSDLILPTTAHEIGHAFDLEHSHKEFIENQVDVMFAPVSVILPLKNYAFSLNDASFLEEGGRLSIQEDTGNSDQAIDADINGDGYVDLHDVIIVRSATRNQTSYDTDLNNDGITDEIDVLLVKAVALQVIAAAAPSKPKFKLTVIWGDLKRK